MKIKRRRTEKTVRRSFIYMEKASKIAVIQRKSRKKAPKNGAFYGWGFIINSMRKQSTGLFTVKSASTFEFRGSSLSALTAKQKRHPQVSFCFGRGRRTWSRLPARSVLLHFVQRSPPETRTPQHAPRASESKSFYSMPKQKRSPFGNRFRFGRGRRT